VSIWTLLVYLLVFLTALMAVVGGLQVLRRFEARQRLREELHRLERDLPDGGGSDDGAP
jgi:hypothetical protein